MHRIDACLLLLLSLPMTAAAQKNELQAQPKVVTQWVEAWNSHDVEKVLPVFTADVWYEDVTFGATNHGFAELRKFADFFFAAVPDMRFEVTKSSIEGRHGSIEWTFTGTDTGVYKTGKKFSVRGVSIIELNENGKVSRNLDFYDSATIMRQVGLLPAPGSTDK